ncbi:MAG: hypothetical protein K6E88_09310 [Lachnospiraceae bacterium]|nr:hypothetical protein [Lachnospiraceae bacterium]
MNGIIKKRIFITGMTIVIAAAMTAAIFAALYYTGCLLPRWAKWHDVTIDVKGGKCITDGREEALQEPDNSVEEGPDMIELKHRKVRAYKDGRCIFESPGICRVQNVFYEDIDRDGKRELIFLNFNVGRFGSHRPFWVGRNEGKWFQHIYIYDYISEEEMFRPIWMASDIGMDAVDMRIKDKGVVEMEDRYGARSDWMWISFGLRCVSE